MRDNSIPWMSRSFSPTRYLRPLYESRSNKNGRQRRRQLDVLSARSFENSLRAKALFLRSLRLVAIGVALGGAGEDLFGDQAGILADRGLDLRGHVGIGLEERFRVLATLPEPLAVVREPGAGLLDDAGLDAEVEDFAHLGDTLAVHDVEFDLLERRRQLVLH